MESFVLSETLKVRLFSHSVFKFSIVSYHAMQYLYLLFDETNPLHKDESNYVFTTEGHILKLSRQHLRPLSPIRRKLRRLEILQCPVYQPFRHGANGDEGELVAGIPARPDAEYARVLVGTTSDEGDERWWSIDGFCEVPITELYVS